MHKLRQVLPHPTWTCTCVSVSCDGINTLPPPPFPPRLCKRILRMSPSHPGCCLQSEMCQSAYISLQTQSHLNLSFIAAGPSRHSMAVLQVCSLLVHCNMQTSYYALTLNITSSQMCFFMLLCYYTASISQCVQVTNIKSQSVLFCDWHSWFTAPSGAHNLILASVLHSTVCLRVSFLKKLRGSPLYLSLVCLHSHIR